MKNKDLIICGGLAGMVGNIPKAVLGWIFHFSGYLRYTFEHLAAGAYVSVNFLDNPVSLAIGAITDWIMAASMGIALLYVIQKTGCDYPIIKGLYFSALLYGIIYGALMALNVTRASLLTPLPNLLLLFPHLAYGITAGWYIKKFIIA